MQQYIGQELQKELEEHEKIPIELKLHTTNLKLTIMKPMQGMRQ